MDKVTIDAAITVNGATVTGSEFQKIIDTSLSKISTLTENITQVEERISNAVKDAKVLSGEVVEGYDGKKSSIGDLSPVERRRIWSLGIKVIDDEKSFDKLKSMLKDTASVLKDVAGAQYDADKVLADVLSYQRDLANEMQYLYGIAAVNMDQCRWVAESITLRIKRASQGELNEAEIECLNNVLKDLEVQRKHFQDMGSLGSRIQTNRDEIVKIREQSERHSQELEGQRKKDVEHDRELARQRDRDVKHDRLLDDLDKRVRCLEKKGVPVWMWVLQVVELLALTGILVRLVVRG